MYWSRSLLSHALFDRPVLGLAAFSGTGKTTLLKRLLPVLRDKDLRVAVIKQTHHDFDIDRPGKDSYEIRQAGAAQIMIAAAHRWAVITEHPKAQTWSLATLLSQLDPALCDLVLIEGAKREAFPKLELHRPSLGKPLLFPDDPNIIAIAADAALPVEPPVPLLPLGDTEAIATFIHQYCLAA